MFTSSDIVVLILIIVSGILIWIARSSRAIHRKDVPNTHDRETQLATDQMGAGGDTHIQSGHEQSKKENTPSNDR